MDFNEYRKRGKEMVDYIADYLENIRDRRVFPSVKPGYMRNLLPDSAPVEGEEWEKIFGDIEKVIMPGVTHWQSPHMHAYFPALNSFPSMLGDMLADAINSLGFTWASSPACTELEIIVMNWLGKMIGLPDDFLHMTSNSKGGGVIQTTASEATLVCLLAGRTRAIKRFHEKSPGYQDAEINARLVAYCSDQAHSSVEKAALIGLVRMRYIESDDNLALRGQPLREAIQDDIKQGLIPFWVCGTLGTTGACAFDNLEEVGEVCCEHKLWLHLDAAYAGSAFVCPEHRIWLKGIEKADSIAFNPSKWLMVHFDCTAMWVKDSTAVHRTFNVEPLYLQHENSGLAIDYMHWQIPLSKRFRSLKLWFVLRSFGIKGLQKHIREGVRLAQKFEALVLADPRYEIPAQRYLGMVVFRIKGENELTERLLKRLNHRGNLHCVPASLKGKYVIRFTVTSPRTTVDDILGDWSEIRQVTTTILEELNIKINVDRARVPLKETREKNEAFGSSLLLSNSPMSPKIVNGSFAAIFDTDEFLAKTYAGIRITHQDSPSMRRRVRGILMSGKQFSLDSHMDLVVHSCIDSAGKDGAIAESSEEVWEASDLSPGTPPTTPSPMVSPFLLTPQLERSIPLKLSPNIVFSTSLGVPDAVPVQSKKLPSTLNVSNFLHRRHRMVYVHSFDTSYITPGDFHKMQEEDSISTLASNNNFAKSLPLSAGAPGNSKNSPSPPAVYHGKRYLDSPPSPPCHNFATFEFRNLCAKARDQPESEMSCAFYNNAFMSASNLSRYTFQSSVYENEALPEISEIEFEENVDWDAVKRTMSPEDGENSSKGFPKILVRVSDELGRRIKTSFDSSRYDPNSSSEIDSYSASSLWSSLECEHSNGIRLGNDGWTIVSEEHNTCCQKCGHRQDNDEVP